MSSAIRGTPMRRRVAAIAALAVIIGAAFAASASAQTAFWARAAVASSEYGNAGSTCTDFVDPSLPRICRPGVGVNGAGGSDISHATIVGAWTASQATGPPDTYPSCGDIGTAWAPASSGTDPEWITLSYAPIDATRVDIYETNLGGFVTQVNVLRPDGTQDTVFTGPDTTPCPGILSIPVSGQVVGVDIHTQAPGWEEIDAAAVYGEIVSAPSP
jgi:hypothetical protein